MILGKVYFAHTKIKNTYQMEQECKRTPFEWRNKNERI